MDFLEPLFGRDRGRGDIGNIVRSFSRWIVGCGCLLALLIVAAVAAVVSGVISFGESAVAVIIVFVMVVVAVVSLIRGNM